MGAAADRIEGVGRAQLHAAALGQRLLRALVVVLVGADEVGDREEEVVRPEEEGIGRLVRAGARGRGGVGARARARARVRARVGARAGVRVGARARARLGFEEGTGCQVELGLLAVGIEGGLPGDGGGDADADGREPEAEDEIPRGQILGKVEEHLLRVGSGSRPGLGFGAGFGRGPGRGPGVAFGFGFRSGRGLGLGFGQLEEHHERQDTHDELTN